MLVENEPSPEWWRFICDAKLGDLAVWACSRLRHELAIFLWFQGWVSWLAVVLWRMRFRPLYLYEALRAYGLITTAGLVEMRWIIHEANRTLHRILVEEGLRALPVDIRVFGQVQLLRSHVGV